jgi:hypothetical protein
MNKQKIAATGSAVIEIISREITRTKSWEYEIIFSTFIAIKRA